MICYSSTLSILIFCTNLLTLQALGFGNSPEALAKRLIDAGFDLSDDDLAHRDHILGNTIHTCNCFISLPSYFPHPTFLLSLCIVLLFSLFTITFNQLLSGWHYYFLIFTPFCLAWWILPSCFSLSPTKRNVFAIPTSSIHLILLW